MSFVGFGAFELLLILASSTGVPNDVVSFVDPELYFESRDIPRTAARMAGIADQAPTNTQEGVARLVALRWMAENPGEVKDSEMARKVLARLAEGKAEKDELGFSRDYARQALARVEGKALEAPPKPAKPLSEEGLAYFPKDCTLVAAVEGRGNGPADIALARRLRISVTRLMSPNDLGQFYDFVDQVGNFRIDQASFAMATDANGRNQFFIRFAGLGDAKALADFMSKAGSLEERLEEKGPNGEPIRIVYKKDQPPACAFIGNSEMLLAGPENAGESLPNLRKMLAVRAGKEPSVLKGPLAERLKDVPAAASLLAAGTIPPQVRQGFANGPVAMPAPRAFTFDITRGKLLDLRLKAELDGKDEAKAFVRSIENLKNQGIEALKVLPPNQIKPATAAAFRKALEGLKTEADGTAGKLTIGLTAEFTQALQDWMEQQMAQLRGGLEG